MSALLKSTRLHFRPMREKDLASVHVNETLAYPHPWPQDIFHDCLVTGYSCRVAEVGDLIVGHGVMSIADAKTRILNICIAPKWQGRGFGRQLVEHLLSIGQEHGALMAFLEVRPSNATAIHLYESAGFREVSRRDNYYPTENGREDAIIMTLGLDPAGIGFSSGNG